jgi:hypothetical protein
MNKFLGLLLALFSVTATAQTPVTSLPNTNILGGELITVVQAQAGGGCTGITVIAGYCGAYITPLQLKTYIGSTSLSFGSITSGTSAATLVIGPGGTLATTGGGNIAATTAAGLAASPTLCTSPQVPLGILANGNATGCFTPSGSGNLTVSGSAQYYVLVSSSATAATGVAAGITGQPLVSNGPSAYPGYSASLAGVTSVNGTSIPAGGTLTQTIGSGVTALGTGSISSATCASVVAVAASGVTTTDVVGWSFNVDPTAMVGYQPSTSGMLTIISYPTSGNANFKVCNNTSASITPGAVSLNWRVTR